MILSKINRLSLLRRAMLYVSMVILAAIVFLAVFELLGITHIFRQNSSTNTQVTEQDRQKKEAVVANGGVPVSPTNSKDNTTTGNYEPPRDDSGITLEAKTATSSVVVTTKLLGYSDGTCTLTITNGSQTSTQSASVIYAPDFSTCAGFTVPIKNLGFGTWNIDLQIASGGTTIGKSITYEVR